jgi:hypothetical protein
MSERYPTVEVRIPLTRAAHDALFGPDPGERAGNWLACRECLRLARVAVTCATDPTVTRTPAAHWAAAVRHLLEAQTFRERAKRARRSGT